VPYNDDYKTGGLEWDGKDPALREVIRYSITDFDLFETFGMEFAAGRSFSASLPEDRQNYVINEKAAAYMGLKEPVGARLKFWGREGRIIGVVKDFHHVSLHREIMPQVFTINPRFHSGAIRFIFIKVSPGGLPQTLREVQETAGKYAPDYPFEAAFLDRGTASLYESEERLGRIFTAFAFLAVFISCLGILGLAAYSVEQRTKEIGVRKVLGATSARLVWMMSGDYAALIGLAVFLAVPIGYFLSARWLGDFAYRIPLSWWIFAGSGLLVILLTMAAMSFRTLRAAGANPVESLRYE
jgi:hypothetical protein